MAPNLLKSLAIRENRPFYDFWKGDIYSLGMTILEVTTFGNCYNCYDWNNHIIINQFIEELLKSARTRYSEFLCNFLREMLAEEESSRPSFE